MSVMKILMVGSNSAYAIERYYFKYLIELGAEVRLFNSADIVFNFHSKNIVNKILFKTKIKTNYATVNEQLLEMAYAYKPDIIWVFKGMEIYPKTLNVLRNDFKLANYNPDHPFIIANKGSGNENVIKSVGLFHIHFCYNQNVRKKIETQFNIPTVFLPFAVETSDIIYSDPNKIVEIPKICLQANPDKERINSIELLTKNGFDVDVYGHGWNKTKLKKNRKVSIFAIASRKNFWRKNQEYLIQLNLFRKYNLDSHNMRTFEIPAVGGIQLTPYSKEQASFFEKEKEIFLFTSDEEMISKAQSLFKLTIEERNMIRRNARKRFIESNYTFFDRSLIVFNTFEKMIRG